MTYLGFLFLFLAVPIVILASIAVLDHRRGRRLPEALCGWPAWLAILLHVVIALGYTTLWDNYLVATRVWWYDPALVTGITIGWVPIEEYTFFVLQPILAGLWLLFLMRRLPLSSEPGHLRAVYRVLPVILMGVLWLASAGVLAAGWRPGTYLALELVWALPPIMLQIAFGGDILVRYGRLVALSILPLALYLSAADYIAIGAGTWTINPEQSTNLLIGGVLPIEEFLFFLVTNTLITFGVVLFVAQESQHRLRAIRQRLARPSVRAGVSKQ